MIVPEIIEAIWYKLRFLGVTVDGTTELFCDKNSVVKNSSIPTPIYKNSWRHFLPKGEIISGCRCYLCWLETKVV